MIHQQEREFQAFLPQRMVSIAQIWLQPTLNDLRWKHRPNHIDSQTQMNDIPSNEL